MSVNFIDTLTERRSAIETELRTIADRLETEQRAATSDEDTAIAAKVAELAETDKQLDGLRAIKAARDGIPAIVRGPGQSGHASGFDDAHRLIDAEQRSGLLPDYAAERATALLTDGPMQSRSVADRWVRAAGSSHYRSAFAKLLGDPDRGHMLWTPEEADAYRQVVAVQGDIERASMSTTGANGGYMIPLTLDPAIMLTNDGSINPLRQLATVKQTTTNAWQGVNSAGVTAEWKAEGVEVADASPTLSDPTIPVHLGDAYVTYSYEVGMDAADLLGQLTEVLGDAAEQLQATAYTTGTGIGQPRGIVTGLVGTASQLTAAGEALVANDVYNLQNALPARFSGNATWQSHIATGNNIRRFQTTNGSHEFPELRENPPTLLGKRWFENSNMDGTVNAAVTDTNYALLYGDVAKSFFIVDRIGTTIEFVQNVIGANNRPTTQRGALMYFRTGSDVVIPQAMRLLNIATTV